MKNIFYIVMIISFFFVSSVHALEAPKELRASSASDTSISLDWSDVDGSVGYYLYYGEKTGSGGSYEVEGVNLIEQSEFTLKKLKPETKYFLAVTSVDTLSTESEFSNELEYTTLAEGAQNTVSALRIEGVEIIDSTSIEMVFSKDIDVSGAREFILQEQDTGLENTISVSEVSTSNPKKIIAVLESELSENTQYKLTVLDIQDTDGGNISAGIDAFTNFTTSTFVVEAKPDLNSAGPEENVNDSMEELNQNQISVAENAQEVSNNISSETLSQSTEKNKQDIGNAGKTVSSEDLSKNTAGAASDNTKLPKTGPEHWGLALIAVMISAGIYYRTKK